MTAITTARARHRLPAGFLEVREGTGPVLATAIHAGRQVRPALLEYLGEEALRHREEDPLTDLFAAAADACVVVRRSRFDVDLNRPRSGALRTDPGDTWGIRIWQGPVPAAEVAESEWLHDRFFALMKRLIERQLDRVGQLLVLDVHSYNHRREGPDAAPAPVQQNPDIDLGITELDWPRWGRVVEVLADALGETPLFGRPPVVGYNVRYPDGGYFPRWLNRTFDARVCALTLEYKKVYMDEWTNTADLAATEALRSGLAFAIERIRPLVGDRRRVARSGSAA